MAAGTAGRLCQMQMGLLVTVMVMVEEQSFGRSGPSVEE